MYCEVSFMLVTSSNIWALTFLLCIIVGLIKLFLSHNGYSKCMEAYAVLGGAGLRYIPEFGIEQCLFYSSTMFKVLRCRKT